VTDTVVTCCTAIKGLGNRGEGDAENCGCEVGRAVCCCAPSSDGGGAHLVYDERAQVLPVDKARGVEPRGGLRCQDYTNAR
jgi:hypothetical protein